MSVLLTLILHFWAMNSLARMQRTVTKPTHASDVYFGGNFLKQKLQGTPNLVGAGYLLGPQIQKDLGPMFWSHGHSYWRLAFKIKVFVYVPNSFLMRLDTLYPVCRGQKGGLVGLWSISRAFWWKIYATKVAGHPQLSGNSHLFGYQIWKDLGQVCFRSHGAPLWRGVYKIRSCSVCS